MASFVFVCNYKITHQDGTSIITIQNDWIYLAPHVTETHKLISGGATTLKYTFQLYKNISMFGPELP